MANEADPLAGRAPHPSSSLAERLEARARTYDNTMAWNGEHPAVLLREAATALRASSESTPPGSEKRPGETEKRCSATPTFGSDLTFYALRAANTQRQSEWDRDDKITLSYRGNELAGEVGEACNVLKKIERERLGIRGSRDTVEHLAEELADVVICVDLVAQHEGIDLGQAVCAKFNATSEKQGLKTRLTAPSEDVEPAQDERDKMLTALAERAKRTLAAPFEVSEEQCFLAQQVLHLIGEVRGVRRVSLPDAEDVCEAIRALEKGDVDLAHGLLTRRFDEPSQGVEQSEAAPTVCDTTMTERQPRERCVGKNLCDTYPANYGPCRTWAPGPYGRCPYCDHSKACHRSEPSSPAPTLSDAETRALIEEALSYARNAPRWKSIDNQEAETAAVLLIRRLADALEAASRSESTDARRVATPGFAEADVDHE